MGTYNNLVRNMAKKGIMEDRLMYALNPRTYSSHPSDGHSTAEGFLLACMGFDIIGEKHIGYGSGGDDKTPLEINIFRRDEIVLQRREASNLYVDFPESELDSFYFERSDARARRLRRLFNAEQMEFAFGDLREAIDGGRASGHLQSKPGLTRDKLGAVRGVGEYYDGTIGRELSEYAD